MNFIYPFDTKKYEIKIAIPTGKYTHENFPESRYATDFILPLGTSIFSSEKGIVINSKHDSNQYFTAIKKRWTIEEVKKLVEKFTNCICIKHDRIYTEYLHLNNVRVVNPNQRVKRGELIGYVGMTGFTTEPHLHFNPFKIEGNNAVSISIRLLKH